MAVAPLFVATLDALKARLRLSDANSTDALAMVDQAVEEVRAGFYQRLGKSRVDALLAIAYVENATTTSALQRTQANITEVAWVRLLLIQRMPMLFMDAGGVTMEAWNEEHVSRRPPSKAEIERLEAQVAEGLAILAQVEDDQGSVQALSIDPETTPDVPGQTIFPIVRT